MSKRRILSISVMPEFIELLDKFVECGFVSSKSEFIRSAISEKFVRDIEVLQFFFDDKFEMEPYDNRSQYEKTREDLLTKHLKEKGILL